MKLLDQVVLLTGGAGSIGRHIVESLLPETGRMIVVDKDREALARLRSRHEKLTCYGCDLAEPAEVHDTIERVYAEQPAVTVLLNNAGVIHSEPLINILAREDKRHSLDTWKRTIDCNLNSVFYASSCVAERMVGRRTKGLILNMSSIAAAGNVGQSAYAAAKAAVNALTVTWSQELAMFGIRVAAIAPGFLDTTSTRDALSEANLQKWTKRTPSGRLGKVDELVRCVRFVIGNDFFNGRILELDGGLRI